MSDQKQKNSPQTLKIYVLSDSIGEIPERLLYAVLTQFPTIKEREIKKFPFIDNTTDLVAILKDAVKEQAIVITTLVNRELNKKAKEYVKQHDLLHIDYLADLFTKIAEKTEEKPVYESEGLHAVDEEYFDRMAAIEFAVKYDDGKNPKGFLKSDIVLLGISRTSKTPLSMYLANHTYKVSNLPLIPEVKLAPEIVEIPPHKIFGLIASPQYIMRIRSERIRMMGLGERSSYNDLNRIREELSYAEEVFDQLGVSVINIENRSIEEIAQHIDLQLNK